MSRLSRRTFLGGAALAAGAAVLPIRRARAATSPECKVLEIFLDGGLYHWPAFGHPSFSPTATSLYGAPATDWSAISTTDAWSPYVVGSGSTTSGGIIFGAPAYPLLASGLDASTRVVATGHDLDPHEAAQLHTLTGGRMGRTRVAGLTAIISHAWAQANGPGLYGVVVETSVAGQSYASFNAALTGELGSAYKPVVIPSANLAAFNSMLGRSGASSTDAILADYQARYAQRMVHPTDGTVRSIGWEDYSAGVDQLFDYAAIQPIVNAATVPSASNTFTSNPTRSGILYAIDLLISTSLRSACVIDHGVQVGYDTHNNASATTQNAQGGNLWNVLRAIGSRAADLTGNNILVVIHGEFGRLQSDSDATGTEHWPRGYATILTGGPLTNPGWAGGFQENSSDASRPYAVNPSTSNHPMFTPTDIVAAVSWAAGAADPYGDYLDVDLAGELAQGAPDSLTAIDDVATSMLDL